MADPYAATIGSPYHHQDERECFRLQDGTGWLVWRRETGVMGQAERCDRDDHPAPRFPPEQS